MKIWVKYVIGIIAGLIMGAFIPAIPSTLGFFNAAFTFLLNLGQYALFPLVFFAAILAIYELSLDEKVLRVFLRSILLMLGLGAVFILIGILGFYIFAFNGLPTIIDQPLQTASTDLSAVLTKIFPANAFEVFTSSVIGFKDGAITVGPGLLLPVFILAFFIGTNSTFDRMTTKPAISLFESLNSIFFHINTFLVEMMGLGLVLITARFVLVLKSQATLGYSGPLILSLAVSSFLIVFGVFPALMYWLSRKKYAFTWIYAMIGPAITAFFTGNNFFASTALIEHGRRSLGIKRKIGGFVFPLYALFGRAGTAMVTAVAFLTILKSYSVSSLNLLTVVWVVFFSLIISFALPAVPGMGVIAALGLLSSLYGKGLIERHVILQPAYTLLIGFAVFLDVLSAGFCSLLVADKYEEKERVLLRDFV